jgi:hypothetical protein
MIIVDLNSIYVYTLTKSRLGTIESTAFSESFFDYLMGDNVATLIPLGLVLIGLFFVGIYVSNLLVRPLRQVASFCDESVKDVKKEYEPDYINIYRYFSGFCEFFFVSLSLPKREETKKGVHIARYYHKINGPMNDWLFIVYFTLLMILVSGISCYTVVVFNDSLYQSLIKFVIDYAQIDSSMSLQLLQYQSKLLYSLYLPVMVLSIILNFILATYMYSKVSGASYSVFSTMRAFIKGNHGVRVSLSGFNVVKSYTRAINKYLDHVESIFKTTK